MRPHACTLHAGSRRSRTSRFRADTSGAEVSCCMSSMHGGSTHVAAAFCAHTDGRQVVLAGRSSQAADFARGERAHAGARAQEGNGVRAVTKIDGRTSQPPPCPPALQPLARLRTKLGPSVCVCVDSFWALLMAPSDAVVKVEDAGGFRMAARMYAEPAPAAVAASMYSGASPAATFDAAFSG